MKTNTVVAISALIIGTMLGVWLVHDRYEIREAREGASLFTLRIDHLTGRSWICDATSGTWTPVKEP